MYEKICHLESKYYFSRIDLEIYIYLFILSGEYSLEVLNGINGVGRQIYISRCGLRYFCHQDCDVTLHQL